MCTDLLTTRRLGTFRGIPHSETDRTLQFPFTLVAGHVILDVGGRPVLFDTGCPSSFGEPGVLEPLAPGRELPGSVPPFTLEGASAGIGELAGAGPGFRVDALLGCDLLAGCTVDLDWQSGVLIVALPGGVPPPSSPFTCVPRMVVTLDGRQVDTLVDTGAWLSYVAPDLVSGAPTVGRRRDFNPSLGWFEADLVRCRFAFGHATVETDVGVAPPGVLLALSGSRCGTVVGTDLLARAGTTRFVFHGATSDAAVLPA